MFGCIPDALFVPMYIETVANRNPRPAILLRLRWREGKRVRSKTLANRTDWPAEKVEALRQVLEGQRLLAQGGGRALGIEVARGRELRGRTRHP